jgi:hypothetical protein
MSDRDAKGKIDDGSVCPESMNGEHCGHYYYDWAPDVPGEPHPGHNGPHCCYCDKDREYRYKTPEWLTARLAELESVPVLETPPPPNDEKKKEVRRAFRAEARNEPLGVDVSDFGDEFVEGFLNGQENALGFIEMVLDGTMATFDQARFVKPWLEALLGAPVEPVPAPSKLGGTQ